MELERFNFEKLNVYQKALDFVDFIYNVSARFPKEERFVLVDQFRRAAISVCLNISEGYGTSNPEFKRYLKISKGSVRECIAITELIKRRDYIDEKVYLNLRAMAVEISKMLSGLISSLV